MIRIAMLSKWHVHAAGYAGQIKKMDDAVITCVWDDDQARGQAWADELGVGFSADLAAVLARKDVDAVVVDAPTNDHARVMIAAANAGKHIFTEKAMAPTLTECKAISAAVATNSVKFCISFPNLTTALIQFAKKAIDDSLLGKIHYLRLRTAHAGALMGWLPDYWYDVEKAGGGAMMDLGCHPMYTASYLLGPPSRIASVFNTNCSPPPGEDNAVSVVEFQNKAIAVLETAFVSPWSANCFELLGTEGAIVSVDGQVKIRSKHYPVNGWVIPDKLPDATPMALRLWLDGIQKGTSIPFGTDRGEALTELLENAYRSHHEQAIISIS